MNHIPFKPRTLGLITAAVLALLALGLFVNRTPAPDPATPAVTGTAGTAKPALTVTLIQAKSGILPIKLAANGSVAAWQEASMGAETSGLRVAELHASVGDSVQQGPGAGQLCARECAGRRGPGPRRLAEAKANARKPWPMLTAPAPSGHRRPERPADQPVPDAGANRPGPRGIGQSPARFATAAPETDPGCWHPTTASSPAAVPPWAAVVAAGNRDVPADPPGPLEWRAEVTSTELGRLTRRHRR